MSTNSRDVVVVGGGIVGCISGYLLSRRGLKVTVLEADSIGSHASGFAFGGLDPLHGVGLPEPLLEFSLWSYGRHRSLTRELQEATGIDLHFQIQDRLYLAFDDTEVRAAKEDLDWMRGVGGFGVEWLDFQSAQSLEPQLNRDCIGALLQQGAGSLEPHRLLMAAVRAGERQGMHLVQRRATGLETAGERCTGVVVGNDRYDAGAVVLAMGPWAQQASEWCGVDIPVTPLKGEILRLRSDRAPLAVGLNYAGNYAATKPDGLIWAGSTEVEAGFDDNTTSAARDSVMEDLLKMAPGLWQAELVQQTACLRPVTPDGMPIVAKLPGWENVYVATGAGRKGILWSTGMCHILVDLVTQGSSEVAGAEHLDLARFQEQEI